MIRYRVELTPDDNDTFLVTAPDFPEVITLEKHVKKLCIMPSEPFVK